MVTGWKPLPPLVTSHPHAGNAAPPPARGYGSGCDTIDMLNQDKEEVVLEKEAATEQLDPHIARKKLRECRGQRHD
eukprot:8672583-Prorocentrum_lima.AAC.1